MAKRSSRKQGRIDLYEVASGLYQLQEGFRLYWFRSSEKARRDWDEREEKIASAMDQLRALADPVRKRKPKKEQTRSEEHTSELQSQSNLVCRLLLEKKNKYRGTRSSRSSSAGSGPGRQAGCSCRPPSFRRITSCCNSTRSSSSSSSTASMRWRYASH